MALNDDTVFVAIIVAAFNTAAADDVAAVDDVAAADEAECVP